MKLTIIQPTAKEGHKKTMVEVMDREAVKDLWKDVIFPAKGTGTVIVGDEVVQDEKQFANAIALAERRGATEAEVFLLPRIVGG